MSHTLTGHDAIEYAETHGAVLHAFAGPTEGARSGLTTGEARAIAAADPSLVWVVAMRREYGRLRSGMAAATAYLHAKYGEAVRIQHHAHGACRYSADAFDTDGIRLGSVDFIAHLAGQ
jgi:hypothetical protein